MADIFISYSRKDSEQAISFAERLRASGMNVWIDQHGLEAASLWSKEIVAAIDSCAAFVLLLSKDSLVSKNVMRELSIASESERPILPVELEAIVLPDDFIYQLAGIQRAQVSDFEGILRALAKLGIQSVSGVQGTKSSEDRTDVPAGHLTPVPGHRDTRTSLMVLPLEDYSPGGDNAWFSDGLTVELIDALSHIKSLRLIDRKTSMGFKGFRGRTIEIAKEYDVRYFIEGSVRKFGDQIKISVSLLDSVEGDYLWQESLKGVFADIFDIQETVAKKVVEGFKLHLTTDETKRAIDRGTENAEAYELYIRGGEYFNLQMREAWKNALQLYTDAIRLDPMYANAYRSKANTLASLYRTYEKDPKLLVEGEQLIHEALRLKPYHWESYHALSHILLLQGKLDEAEKTAKMYVTNAPDDAMSHFSLGFFYFSSGDSAKAIPPYEEVVRLNPDYRVGWWNLVVACFAAKETEKGTYYAGLAIPHFEKHVKLHPDDESMRMSLAFFLKDAGRIDEAREAAKSLVNLKDGTSLFNAACLAAELDEMEVAFQTYCRSIEAGYRNMNLLRTFFEETGLDPYIGTPDYERAKQLFDTISSEIETKV